MDLGTELYKMLPTAIAWAKSQEQLAMEAGAPLDKDFLDIAYRVGVQRPNSVRVMIVDQLPQPEDPSLQEAARKTGLLGPEIKGLTLGYAIFIVSGHKTVRLLSHECRHVNQYEKYGSIDAFLSVYLKQIVVYGYQNAPLEVDARQHEVLYI